MSNRIQLMNLYANNPLHSTYLRDFDSLASLYGRDPRFPKLLDSIPAKHSRPLTHEDLEELVEFNTLAFSDRAAVRAQIEKIRDPRCVVIMTGQQAGLLLGPLYTPLKAMHAILLAKRVEEETGRPTVPIFWIAADDHDFEEVAEIAWPGTDGSRHSAMLIAPPDSGGKSVGKLDLNSGMLSSILAQIADASPPFEFAEEISAHIESAISRSATIGDFFRDLLLGAFQSHGLIAVDPWFSPLKRCLHQIVGREITDPGASTEQILAVSEELKSRGFTPQVFRRPGDVNLFVYVNDVRARILHSDGKFSAVHPATEEILGNFTGDELEALMKTNPERFSPNVATKPQVRDHVFQPLAYIGGPGEISYHAQLKPLYDQAGVAMPALVSRTQVAIVNNRVKRALGRMGMTAEQWLSLSGVERAEEIAKHSASSDKLASFESLREELASQLERLETVVVDLDPGLRKSVERMRGSVTSGLEKLSGQMIKSAQQSDTQISEAVAKIESSLTPGGSPQERVDNLYFPHLAMFGLGFVDRMMNWLDPLCTDLQIFDAT